MLFAYSLANFGTFAQSGPFTLVTPNYLALCDQRPGVKALWTQNTAGTQTLTLTLTLDTASVTDVNGKPYPYLLLGVINIGNARGAASGGQLTPVVTFLPNGKWGGGGTKTVTAVIGPSGYAAAWAVVRKAEQVGSTNMTQVVVTLTGNFVTAFGNFGIGEIVVAGADELPINDLDAPMGDPSMLNRASGNAAWPVMRIPFRTFKGQLIPQLRGDSMLASSKLYSLPLQRILFAAVQSGAVVLAPLWRTPGTVGPDLPTLQENCYMARLTGSPPDQHATVPNNRFAYTLTGEELL